MDTPSPTLPTLVLWRTDGCGLCRETRHLLGLIMAERAAAGLSVPAVVERDLAEDPTAQRAFLELIPVLELRGRRLELALRPEPIRDFLAEALDGAEPRGRAGSGAGVELRP